MEFYLCYFIKYLFLLCLDLCEFIESVGVWVCICCYWDNESGECVLDVLDDICVFMELIGGVVEIDEY